MTFQSHMTISDWTCIKSSVNFFPYIKNLCYMAQTVWNQGQTSPWVQTSCSSGSTKRTDFLHVFLFYSKIVFQKRSQNRMGMGARWRRAVTRVEGPLVVERRTRASPGGDTAGSGPTSRLSSCKSWKQPLHGIATLIWRPERRSQPGRVSQNQESGYV